MILFGITALLCIFTQFAGVLVVVLAVLSIFSQMMHSKNFDLGKKQQKNYSVKSTIRDARSILIFYRCIFSLVMYLFGFVFMQIIEGESSPKSQVPNPSFTKKFFSVVCIGLSASGTNVIVAKSIDKLFNNFFYKT